MDSVAIRTFTSRELILLLALTALPVALTSTEMSLLRTTGALAVLTAHLDTAYVAFLTYAVANWVTFAAIVAVAGGTRLQRYGLRLAIRGRHLVAAIVAFVAGLVVYGIVTAFSRAIGLPPMRGMDYPTPGVAGVVLLVAATVVTAPFCEEVFFRVLWIGALKERMPVPLAIIASIVAFAAIHYPYFGASGVLFISVWTLLPIALFIAFEDMSASTAMHALNNAFAYVLIPMFLR